MKHALRFLGAFLRDPRSVSSIIPTAQWNAQRICNTIPSGTRRTIVEYGPGTGAITDHLLHRGRLADDCRLMLIEQDPTLARMLREKYRHDKRVHVFAASAENVRSIIQETDAIDHVIASIPFSTIPKNTAEHIIEQTHGILKPGGEITVFQVRSTATTLLQGHPGFSEPVTEHLFLNLPPLTVTRAKKTTNVHAQKSTLVGYHHDHRHPNRRQRHHRPRRR